MIRTLGKWFFFLCLLTFSAALYILWHVYQNLPDVETLRDVQLQVPLRIFSQDHKLIAEFGEKRRVPVQIHEVPEQLIHAFIATEDRRFYQHYGVDVRGLMRAVVHLITAGNKGQGGSTLTMQVARNFFLSRKKTYTRKLNEIMLAFKIEQELSKDEILELYLNKVFLGYRAYGVAAAAEVYYGKSLHELTLAQSAMIAGLPKAPSAINPLTNPEAALKRRSHVLDSMCLSGYITPTQQHAADSSPLTASYHGTTLEVRAPYVAEMVRKTLIERFGAAAYTEGYQVFTTLDSHLQDYANRSLVQGLLAYDQRHGLRPLLHIENSELWMKTLEQQPVYADMLPAVVTRVDAQEATVFTKLGETATLSWPELAWARKSLGHLRVTYPPKQATDILTVGDIVYIYQQPTGTWQLGQIPEVEGALVSLDAHNGAIKALVGGFDFNRSKFNRATQAELQPGSNFKPFIYAAALAHGYSPASIINDAPVVFQDPAAEALWRPQNDNRRFAGPTTFRTALIHSRNLVSIRLLQSIGIDTAIDYIAQFGFPKNSMPKGLSLALGTANVSPLQIANGYAVLANGGFRVTPYFIDHIEDSNGHTVFASSPAYACASDCPVATLAAPRAIDTRDAYIMTNLLQDAIQRGTGRGAKSLGRHDIAGKTGTTNDKFDAWFSGYNADLVATVWLGHDTPKSLGEYAAKAALPIWRDYMAQALANRPEHTLAQPPGVVMVKIDPKTGFIAASQQKNSRFEIFRSEAAPTALKTKSWTRYDSNPNPPLPEQIF